MTIAIDNTIALTITDVTVVTKKIDWRYKKLTFPKLGDSGREDEDPDAQHRARDDGPGAESADYARGLPRLG